MDNKQKKIAVVGAWIFWVTIAWKLAEEWYNVDLYEEKDDIMWCASFSNQYRVHRGYHYPRSIETAKSSKKHELDFAKYYSDAYMDSEHYYNIAKNDSKTLVPDYIKFLDKMWLEYDRVELSCVNNDEVGLSLLSKEKIYDPFVLKDICKDYIKKFNVNLILNTKPNVIDLELKYDNIVLSTFKNNNNYLSDMKKEYNYQLYENLIIDLPKEYKNKSFIILDGDYVCISPYWNTWYSTVVDVKNSIHSDEIGEKLTIPDHFNEILDKWIIKDSWITNKVEIVKTLQKFFKHIDIGQYVGSIFTYKVILPWSNLNVDRPTYINKIWEKKIEVFSGKVVSCVAAAEEIKKMIA